MKFDMKKATSFEKARQFEQAKGKVFKWVSGKWFRDIEQGVELKNPEQYFMKTGWFRDINDCRKFMETYIATYGDPDSDWPEPPICADARHYEGGQKPPAWLTKEQLMIINYLLHPTNEYFFIITGVGCSGKSTFINLIRQIFDGDEASITIDQLSEGFRVASVVNKRLIYSTEISASRINNTDLKMYVSREPINVNKKYGGVYQGRFQGSFIFNCNIPPSINLADTGLLRRIVYYAMNKRIENPDPTLNKKKFTKEELLVTVKAALNMDMSQFPFPILEKDTRDALVKLDTVYLFKDCDNYFEYSCMCRDKGYKPYNQGNWQTVRQLLKDWGYVCESSTKDKKSGTSLWTNG